MCPRRLLLGTAVHAPAATWPFAAALPPGAMASPPGGGGTVWRADSGEGNEVRRRTRGADPWHVALTLARAGVRPDRV